MYKACLHDPIHGSAVATAETAEEAVNQAFQELSSRWMAPEDPSTPFDGEIRGVEVWWHNRAWALLGTVVQAC